MIPVANCPHCGGSLILMKSGSAAEPTTNASPDLDWDALAGEKPNTPAPKPTDGGKAKLATCKRCGESGLAWAQSERTKKFYRCKVDANGNALRREFHQCKTDNQDNNVPFD